MEIIKELWAKSPCGKEIYRYTLKNEKGAYVQLSNIGAGIVSVVVPDKNGALADVVLGYDDPMNYFGDGPCAGKIPGRYANRVALGKFTLDGAEYTLPVNNGPNHLHGGPEGFQNKVWESREHEGGVEFLYYSEDGEILLGSLVVTSEDVTFYTAIVLEKDADDYYYASYRRVDGEVTHMIAGYIESDTFTRNMTVGYNKYEGASYHRESIREIASEHVIYLIDCLGNTVADNLNLTVADFGFVSFS